MAPTAPSSLLAGRYQLSHLMDDSDPISQLYLARDQRQETEVLVRRLRPQLIDRPDAQARFAQVAARVQSFSHPAVAEVLEVAPLYLVSELLNEPALHNPQAVKHFPLSPLNAAGLVYRILSGLASAQAQGLYHPKLDGFWVRQDSRRQFRIAGLWVAPDAVTASRAHQKALLWCGRLLWETTLGRRPGPDPKKQAREMPAALAEVALRAILPREDGGYQDALEFAQALGRARHYLAAEPGSETTQRLSANANANAKDTAKTRRRQRRSRSRSPQVTAVPAPRDRFLWGAGIVAGLLACYILGLLVWLTHTSEQRKLRELPRVVGLTYDQAQERLESQGFTSQRIMVASPLARNTVLEQDPGEGSQVATGTVVKLQVSRGAPSRNVPSVTGLPQDEAVAELEAQGFQAQVQTLISELQPPGRVIGTEPAAGEAAPRQSVVLVKVAKAQGREVPDVVGLDRAQSIQLLRDARLQAQVSYKASSQPRDQVLAQDPAPGILLMPGDSVRLTLSSGEQRATVPDLVGLSRSDAESLLDARGLLPVVIERPTVEPVQKGLVLAQSPRASTRLSRGDQVKITVGR